MKNISLGNIEDATNLNEKRLKKSSYYLFFKGIVHYKKNQYGDAVKSFEDFILQLSGEKIEKEYEELLHEAYATSLYKLKRVARYQQVVDLFLNDKSYEGKVYERLIYFYLENLSLIGTKDAMLKLEELALNYLGKFKDSSYLAQCSVSSWEGLCKKYEIK